MAQGTFYYPNPTPLTMSLGSGGPFVVGHDVTPAVAGLSMLGIYYWKVAGDTVANRAVTVYRASDQTVMGSGTGPASESTSGWQTVTFGAAIALTSGIAYRVALQTSVTNSFANGVGGISYPSVSIGSTGFYKTGTTGFPNINNGNQYYGIDVLFDGLPAANLYASQEAAEVWSADVAPLRASQVLAETWIQNNPPTHLRASQAAAEVWVTDSGPPTTLRSSQLVVETWARISPAAPPYLRVSSQLV